MNSQNLTFPAPIEAVVRLRCEALEALMTARASLMTAADALGRLAPSVAYSSSLHDLERHLWAGGRIGSGYGDFETPIVRHVDKLAWRELFAVSGIERLMDSTAKEQFRNQLEKEPAEVTVENVRATMEHLHADAFTIFSRGVATTFAQLDRRFKSHDGFKIGSRIILDRAFNEYGCWNFYGRREDHIRDVERAIYQLDGKQQPEYADSICSTLRNSANRRPAEVEDDYFRARIFGNGNVHLWFKRNDLVERVNQVLAHYYGAALGDAHRASGGTVRSRSPSADFCFYPSPDAVVEKVIDAAGIKPGDEVLEPSAGAGAIALAAIQRGAKVTAIEIQPRLCAQLQEAGLPTVLQNDFLAIQPSENMMFDRIVMNPPFGGHADVEHILHAVRFLRPGGRLVAVAAAGVEYREDKNTLAVRQLVNSGGRIFSLPAGSFASSGTNVNTCVVVINT